MHNTVRDKPLSEMEIDVIGEVMNISMGSAATAMSTILDKKVSITTPVTETTPVEEFEFSFLEPVVGVLIKYIEGIKGSNVLLLKESDLKKILRHLLSMSPDEDLEFDEISMSAICEIMNQMMGSASSAIASFLGTAINISPPQVLDTANSTSVKEIFSLKGDIVVSIKFNLDIEGLVESEFLCVMEPHLVKDIVKMSLGATEMEEIEEMFDSSHVINEPERNVPKPVEVTSYNYKQLGSLENQEETHSENADNLELIMSVPIQITVELGRTKKKIKDIAELSLGNIVELNRQAGDQVDVLANGKIIARGDVVVVDDNYSVRVTEIIKQDERNS
ncbi:MAG: flagellar motor switch phosphatase FliY [Eubacteriales bacterium]|nr:flagellar motor switch phosphatase FliY [Eubacteriales bacterium]